MDDQGNVTGIPSDKLDVVEQWVLNAATHNCDPPTRPIVRKALLPAEPGGDRHVLLVEVPRGLYVHRTSRGRYYTRVGSTKRDLTPAELARLFQQRGREYVFDEQSVPSATVEDLSRPRLEAFFGRSPTIPWLDLLRNTRVTSRDELGVDRPTVAGLLVFATEPTDFLASGSIEAACYAGTRLSSDDLTHAERLAGPVSDQIDGGIAFVARFMRKAPRGEAEYDIDVVDEAIVNAVAHRDYAITGSKIRFSCSRTAWNSTVPADFPTRSPFGGHGLPHVHAQSAPRQLPFAHSEQAQWRGLPGVAWRGRAEDTRGRRSTLRPSSAVRAVRRGTSVDVVGERKHGTVPYPSLAAWP